jgi:hypothetical protein
MILITGEGASPKQVIQTMSLLITIVAKRTDHTEGTTANTPKTPAANNLRLKLINKSLHEDPPKTLLVMRLGHLNTVKMIENLGVIRAAIQNKTIGTLNIRPVTNQEKA